MLVLNMLYFLGLREYRALICSFHMFSYEWRMDKPVYLWQLIPGELRTWNAAETWNEFSHLPAHSLAGAGAMEARKPALWVSLGFLKFTWCIDSPRLFKLISEPEAVERMCIVPLTPFDGPLAAWRQPQGPALRQGGISRARQLHHHMVCLIQFLSMDS